MSNPDKTPTTEPVEPSRLQMIMLRLGYRYYDVPPASHHIATCVWADLNDSEEHPSVLS